MTEMHAECAKEFGIQGTRITALEADRKRQNGSLQDILRRLDHLGWALAVTLGGVVTILAITLLRGR